MLRVFALVCLIFYVACSTEHVHNAATKTKAKTKKKKKKKTTTKKKKQMKKKRLKNVRSTISVFQHANCRNHP